MSKKSRSRIKAPPSAPRTDQPRRAPDPGTTSPRLTRNLAIAGIVFAILFAPLGVLLSVAALIQTSRTGQAGKGLAITGLVLSFVFLIVAFPITWRALALYYAGT